MRVNARLDEEHVKKLAFLRQKFGGNISEVIKQAIDTYYGQVKQAQPEAKRFFEESGFIGCAEDSADLSSVTKRLRKRRWQ